MSPKQHWTSMSPKQHWTSMSPKPHWAIMSPKQHWASTSPRQRNRNSCGWVMTKPSSCEGNDFATNARATAQRRRRHHNPASVPARFACAHTKQQRTKMQVLLLPQRTAPHNDPSALRLEQRRWKGYLRSVKSCGACGQSTAGARWK